MYPNGYCNNNECELNHSYPRIFTVYICYIYFYATLSHLRSKEITGKYKPCILHSRATIKYRPGLYSNVVWTSKVPKILIQDCEVLAWPPLLKGLYISTSVNIDCGF